MQAVIAKNRSNNTDDDDDDTPGEPFFAFGPIAPPSYRRILADLDVKYGNFPID